MISRIAFDATMLARFCFVGERKREKNFQRSGERPEQHHWTRADAMNGSQVTVLAL
jgi:hypothetical protein